MYVFKCACIVSEPHLYINRCPKREKNMPWDYLNRVFRLSIIARVVCNVTAMTKGQWLQFHFHSFWLKKNKINKSLIKKIFDFAKQWVLKQTSWSELPLHLHCTSLPTPQVASPTSMWARRLPGWPQAKAHWAWRCCGRPGRRSARLGRARRGRPSAAECNDGRTTSGWFLRHFLGSTTIGDRG